MNFPIVGFCLWFMIICIGLAFKIQMERSILRKARVRWYSRCTPSRASSGYKPIWILILTMGLLLLLFSVLFWKTPGVFNWSEHTICASTSEMKEWMKQENKTFILCEIFISWLLFASDTVWDPLQVEL